MGTVEWRRQLTESLNYIFNIGVNEGKLISHGSEFVLSFCLACAGSFAEQEESTKDSDGGALTESNLA